MMVIRAIKWKWASLNKILSFVKYYKIVVITVENYSNAEVHTITIKNKELFWVKMIDVQNGYGIKNVHDLLRK